MGEIFYAHSANGNGDWHPLKEHLSQVSKLAKEFSTNTSWQLEAGLAGLLHDLGKYGDRFQSRLHGQDSGLDHWSQGAWLAISEYLRIPVKSAPDSDRSRHPIPVEVDTPMAACS